MTVVLLTDRLFEAARASTITSTRKAITAIAMRSQVFESAGTSGAVVVVVEVLLECSTAVPDDVPPLEGAVLGAVLGAVVVPEPPPV
jgi:fatty acid/phospholipid biosynthesis enzyme